MTGVLVRRLVAIAVAAAVQRATPIDRRIGSPPGRLIDIGGRALHLFCSGIGRPTVILVAGGGAFSIDWALVQPRISEATRVCSYDRAGLAWSDPGPADETVEETVEDLGVALAKADERGPFVLVGASIGGIFIRAFHHANPAGVAGLVFSNSSNRVGLTVGKKTGLLWDLSEAEIRSAFPLPASVKPRTPPVRETSPFDRLPPELQSVRLALDVLQWERWHPTSMRPDSMLSWRKEFLREFAEMDAAHPLGALPIVVVSSNPAVGTAEAHSRSGAAAALDFLSTNTTHILAAESCHEVHVCQPDKVIDGIMRIVAAIRRHSSL